MKPIIYIGNKTSKKEVKDIIKLIKAGYKYDQSEALQLKTLDTYKTVAEVKGVTISNCVINGNGERRKRKLKK